MSKVPTASLAIPDAITFTRAALNTLGKLSIQFLAADSV